MPLHHRAACLTSRSQRSRSRPMAPSCHVRRRFLPQFPSLQATWGSSGNTLFDYAALANVGLRRRVLATGKTDTLPTPGRSRLRCIHSWPGASCIHKTPGGCVGSWGGAKAYVHNEPRALPAFQGPHGCKAERGSPQSLFRVHNSRTW